MRDLWHTMAWFCSDTDRCLAAIAVLLLTWLMLAYSGSGKHPGAIADRYTTFEQVQLAMRREGLESSSLIVGVDFTKSNEWTGKHSFGGRSMHDVAASEPTPYEQVLRFVAQTLQPFDDDGKIPCYGFGDVRTGDHSVFSFMPGDQACHGLDEAVRRYRSVAAATSLSGPTSFAPLIDKAIEIVHLSKNAFHILLIVADGQVTNRRANVDAIVRASQYPLSIVMVGVGDGPWGTMKEFDDDLPQRRWDNFQFVDFNAVRRRHAANLGPALAVHCLMEVPQQYRIIRELNLVGDNAARVQLRQRPLPSVMPTLPPPPGSLPVERPAAAAVAHEPAVVAAAPLPPTAPAAPADVSNGCHGGSSERRVPDEFVCPLTLSIMDDPVVCMDGFSYERSAIERWLANNNSSPLSNATLPSTAVVPNHALRHAIAAFRAGS